MESSRNDNEQIIFRESKIEEFFENKEYFVKYENLERNFEKNHK